MCMFYPFFSHRLWESWRGDTKREQHRSADGNRSNHRSRDERDIWRRKRSDGIRYSVKGTRKYGFWWIFGKRRFHRNDAAGNRNKLVRRFRTNARDRAYRALRNGTESRSDAVNGITTGNFVRTATGRSARIATRATYYRGGTRYVENWNPCRKWNIFCHFIW